MKALEQLAMFPVLSNFFSVLPYFHNNVHTTEHSILYERVFSSRHLSMRSTRPPLPPPRSPPQWRRLSPVRVIRLTLPFLIFPARTTLVSTFAISFGVRGWIIMCHPHQWQSRQRLRTQVWLIVWMGFQPEITWDIRWQVIKKPQQFDEPPGKTMMGAQGTFERHCHQKWVAAWSRKLFD